jgi:ubiquinone/menaquinone biosynthesis C-methylase UbiE
MHPSAAADDVQRFDAWSATYDRSPAQTLLFKRVHAAVLRALVRSGAATLDIADIGCGTGELALAVSRRLPRAHVTGFDPAPGMIQVASAKPLSQRVRFVTAPAATLPAHDSSFDAVLSTMSMHHWDDAAAALHEIRRVLRGDGVLLIADIYARGLLAPLLQRGHHGHGYATEAGLRRRLRDAGLRLTGLHSIIPCCAPLAVAAARPL